MTTYAHPEWAMWVRAIRANPEDDDPRLQCADWLDEHGEESRAEFVRVGCELGKPKKTHTPIERQKLKQRERWLFSRLQLYPSAQWDWGQYLKPNPSPHRDQYVVARRGFIESVTCPAARWLAHGDTLYAREPVVRVELTTPLNAQFGPIRRWSEDGPFGVTTHKATWLAMCEGPGVQCGQTVTLGPNRSPEERAHVLGRFEKRIAAARTDKGYAELRWPGVEFTLPAVVRPGETVLGARPGDRFFLTGVPDSVRAGDHLRRTSAGWGAVPT